jgi:hypothetical protein
VSMWAIISLYFERKVELSAFRVSLNTFIERRVYRVDMKTYLRILIFQRYWMSMIDKV